MTPLPSQSLGLISFHFIQVKGILITIKQESHLRQLKQDDILFKIPFGNDHSNNTNNITD